MRQAPIIAVMLLVIFLLGMWGQYRLAPTALTAEPLQVAYNTLALFVLEGEWTAGKDLPWQLEITRFVAPLFSIAGVLIILTQGAWVHLMNRLIRFRHDHVVMVGLTDRAWSFVESCAGERRLVIVEKDPENPLVDRARKLGMSVVTGNLRDPLIMRQVRLDVAQHLVVLTGDDGANLEMAIKAREFKQDVGGEPLLVHMHVDNTRMAEKLENYPKFFADTRSASINVFSIFNLNARLLFRDYPPEFFAQVLGRPRVHLALYHFGRQSEHILIEAARVCHFANGSRLRVTVFDDEAATKGRRFLHYYPQLRELCDIEFVDAPLQSSRALDTIDPVLMRSVTEHIVCLPGDGECLEFSLVLRDELLDLGDANAPIMVRMQRSTGLARLLESNVGGPEVPDGLYPFGMNDIALSSENVLADGLDVVARAIHETYLESRGGAIGNPRLHAALTDWNSLPEPNRASNRQTADHLATKLRAVRCRVVPASDDGAGAFRFTAEEAETLARMEQDRYSAEKLVSGWRSGSERIEVARINPLIGPFDNLPAAEREKRVSEIHQLPATIGGRTAGVIRREFRIGVTGHRLHKLDPSDRGLRDRVREALGAMVAAHKDYQCILVSPLAEGADRLVAEVAVTEFGMPLQVQLPLPFELYQADFTDDASVEQFKVLIGSAERYFELPMRFGNREALSVAPGAAGHQNRQQQYALAGAYSIENCDALLAIWDGQPEDGIGGTAQVVRWWQEGVVEPAYRNEADFIWRAQREPLVAVTP